MTNLLNDLSALTAVAPSNLTSMAKLSEAILCHTVVESIKDNEEYAEVDIGIGYLYIKNTDEGIRYKFVPSDHLESVLATSIKYKRSPLSLKVDEVLGRRIMNTYKDLF